ncbi:hypothetical protein FQA39_LY05402 [Lamprigera yunnana]|nr:hypothetical protein FQA39_LY05402 [Lamprigera yunnana]
MHKLLYAFLLMNIVFSTKSDYQIPAPEILISHNALKISIADENGIELFYLQGRLHKRNGQVFEIVLETREKTNGRWVLIDRDDTFEVGDSITYWMYVKKNGLGYRAPYANYEIKDLIMYTTSSTTERFRYTTQKSLFEFNDPVNLDGNLEEIENIECDVTCTAQLQNMTEVTSEMRLQIKSLEETIAQLLDKVSECGNANQTAVLS